MSTATKQLTQAFRAQQLHLRAVTVRDLLTLWPALDPARLDSTYPAWAQAVTVLTQANRAASAASAAQYLTAFRLLKRVEGAPAPVLETVAPAEQVASSLLVTSVVAVKKSMLAGQPLDKAMSNAFVQSSGAVSRLVLDGGRQTVLSSLKVDHRAHGWQRETSGRACDFCQMLAGRGAVYSADSGDFPAHDHCSCTAEPVY